MLGGSFFILCSLAIFINTVTGKVYLVIPINACSARIYLRLLEKRIYTRSAGYVPLGVSTDLQSVVKQCPNRYSWGFAIPPKNIKAPSRQVTLSRGSLYQWVENNCFTAMVIRFAISSQSHVLFLLIRIYKDSVSMA